MDLRLGNDLPARVKIGHKWVGENEPVFFIAEVGNNHNGDVFLAKRTVEEAITAGADAVKFQKRFVEETFAREILDRPQVKDEIFGKTYGEYRRHLELNKDAFGKLKRLSEERGVTFFATPFDKKSVDFLENVGVDVYKIASFDVTNIPLLEYVAALGKPIILSSGLSTLEELDEAVETILRRNRQLIVLHCISVYPTPDDQLNLSMIPMLKKRYHPLPIGYSGHERDILPSLMAIALGAKVVERHITLDKRMPGPDHATVSIEPDEFGRMISDTRRIEAAFGNGIKSLLAAEKPTREKHCKSVVAAVDIKAGATLTRDMLAVKSPGYGFSPNKLDVLVGAVVFTDIAKDTVLTRAHFEFRRGCGHE